ncbi:ATP-grasp domain-containing protein [Streptomyces niveus]|uniref:ATP-grasp domain-containing protein n=1 Tax=Streptomyces niveus TaxID=193462 RepID=UPI00341B346B
MPITVGTVNCVYRPDDFLPGVADEILKRKSPGLAGAADRAGFALRFIPVQELIPASDDRPRLWHQGEDLLSTRQCYQVDDFSWDPQASHVLKAVYRTIQESDSLLLNRSMDGPEYLATDKLAIAQHAASLGIPTPASIAVPYGRHARSVLSLVEENLGQGPYILKPREMGMGFAVQKIDTFQQLPAAIDMVAQAGTGYIVQPYLPHSADVRIYLTEGEIIAALHRTAGEGAYMTNVSQGGVSRVLPGWKEVEEQCFTIATSLRASCLLIDWLLTPSGPVLDEWSSGFGSFPTHAPEVGDAFFSWVRRKLA